MRRSEKVSALLGKMESFSSYLHKTYLAAQTSGDEPAHYEESRLAVDAAAFFLLDSDVGDEEPVRRIYEGAIMQARALFLELPAPVSIVPMINAIRLAHNVFALANESAAAVFSRDYKGVAD